MGGAIYNSLVKGCQTRTDSNGFSIIVKWLGIYDIIKDCRHNSQKVETDATDDDDDIEDIEDQQARMTADGNDYFDQILNLKEQTLDMLNKICSKTIAFHVGDERATNLHACGKAQNELKNDKSSKAREGRYKLLLKRALVQRLISLDIMSTEESNSITDVWRLSHTAKWRLYRLWITRLCKRMIDEIDELREDFEETSENCNELLMQVNKEIMKRSSIIGMTTTCAAKFQSFLKEIGPRIVIVEEAAEVLEAHIIVALSEICEHLILIGDHKQLRPNPAVYKMAVKYELNISLLKEW